MSTRERIIAFCRIAMADWHLGEIRNELEKFGWRFVAELPGDDYQISATWEFTRDKNEPNILVDFDGLDDMNCLPLEQSYGCSVRNQSRTSLYFTKKGEGKSPARESWRKSLEQFVREINENR